MADKPTLSRAFNTHLTEFLADIINIYPTNSDIIQAKSTFETIKKANPAIMVKAWFKHVYLPYKDIIDSGNITFFFEKDYRQDVQSLANAVEIMNMIVQVICRPVIENIPPPVGERRVTLLRDTPVLWGD